MRHIMMCLTMGSARMKSKAVRESGKDEEAGIRRGRIVIKSSLKIHKNMD